MNLSMTLPHQNPTIWLVWSNSASVILFIIRLPFSGTAGIATVVSPERDDPHDPHTNAEPDFGRDQQKTFSTTSYLQV